MREVGIDFEELDADGDRGALAGVLTCPPGTRRAASRSAARSCRPRGAPPRCSGSRPQAGATLLGSTPVTAVTDHGSHLTVEAGGTSYTCRGVVVAADAWTNQVLAGLGVRDPADGDPGAGRPTSQPADPAPYAVDAAVDLDGRAALLRLPLLRRADRQGGAGLRRAGRSTPTPAPPSPTRRCASGWRRSWASLLPGSGEPVRSLRCQYTLTPDRDFVLAPVPGHPSVVVGLGVGPRLQVRADVRPDPRRPGDHRRRRSSDVSAFGFDRPGLTDPDFEPNWMV